MDTDHDALAARILFLESKVAYQDKLLGELDEVVTAQSSSLQKLERFARLVGEQLAGLGIEVDPTRFQKPPHY